MDLVGHNHAPKCSGGECDDLGPRIVPTLCPITIEPENEICEKCADGNFKNCECAGGFERSRSGLCIETCKGGTIRQSDGECKCPRDQSMCDGTCMQNSKAGNLVLACPNYVCQTGYESVAGLEGCFLKCNAAAGEVHNSQGGCECPANQEHVAQAGDICKAVCLTGQSRDARGECVDNVSCESPLIWANDRCIDCSDYVLKDRVSDAASDGYSNRGSDGYSEGVTNEACSAKSSNRDLPSDVRSNGGSCSRCDNNVNLWKCIVNGKNIRNYADLCFALGYTYTTSNDNCSSPFIKIEEEGVRYYNSAVENVQSKLRDWGLGNNNIFTGGQCVACPFNDKFLKCDGQCPGFTTDAHDAISMTQSGAYTCLNCPVDSLRLVADGYVYCHFNGCPDGMKPEQHGDTYTCVNSTCEEDGYNVLAPIDLCQSGTCGLPSVGEVIGSVSDGGTKCQAAPSAKYTERQATKLTNAGYVCNESAHCQGMYHCELAKALAIGVTENGGTCSDCGSNPTKYQCTIGGQDIRTPIDLCNYLGFVLSYADYQQYFASDTHVTGCQEMVCGVGFSQYGQPATGSMYSGRYKCSCATGYTYSNTGCQKNCNSFCGYSDSCPDCVPEEGPEPEDPCAAYNTVACDLTTHKCAEVVSECGCLKCVEPDGTFCPTDTECDRAQNQWGRCEGTCNCTGVECNEGEICKQTNTCGNCVAGKCECPGTKCNSNQICTGSTNACGNCDGQCLDKGCPTGYGPNYPGGCPDTIQAIGSEDTCYGSYKSCNCPEGKYEHCSTAQNASNEETVGDIKCYTCTNKVCTDYPGLQNNDVCESGKKASLETLNGLNCYRCVDDGCDNYTGLQSDDSCAIGKTATTVTQNGMTCYQCVDDTCENHDLQSTASCDTGKKATESYPNGLTCYRCDNDKCENHTGLQSGDTCAVGKTTTTVIENGMTCYRCDTDSCENHDLQSSSVCPADTKASQVTENGLTCYKCLLKTCEDYGQDKGETYYSNEPSCSTDQQVGYEYPRRGLTCMKCVDKTCSDYGYEEGEGACEEEIENAVPIYPRNGLTCYTCESKGCTDFHYQSSASCSAGYKAEAREPVTGVFCYECVLKTCSDFSGYTSSIPSCTSDQKVTSDNVEGGLYCYKCVDKVCKDYNDVYFDTVSDSSCSKDQKPESKNPRSGLTCYQCIDKVCTDYNSNYLDSFSDTVSSCPDGKRAESRKPRTGLSCYECVNDSCEYYNFKSNDSSCPAGQKAVSNPTNGMSCYRCEDKTCVDYGQEVGYELSTTSPTCATGQRAAADYYGPKNKRCYHCVADSCEYHEGLQSNNKCFVGEVATKVETNGLTCYRCDTDTCENHNLKSNDSSCESGKKAVAVTENNLSCYKCVAKTCADYAAEEGYQLQEDDGCDIGKIAVKDYFGDENKLCYRCDNDSCGNYNLKSDSTSCGLGKKATPVTKNGMTCYRCDDDSCENHSLQSSNSCGNGTVATPVTENGMSCYRCDADTCENHSLQSSNNDCGAGKKAVQVSENGLTCYRCDNDSCENYNNLQSGTNCPAGKKATKVTKNGMTCYRCDGPKCTDYGFWDSVSCSSDAEDITVYPDGTSLTCHMCQQKQGDVTSDEYCDALSNGGGSSGGGTSCTTCSEFNCWSYGCITVTADIWNGYSYTHGNKCELNGSFDAGSCVLKCCECKYVSNTDLRCATSTATCKSDAGSSCHSYK
ncbi:MAG: hypothetical protein VZR95_03550 [Alphaproteobacteria bacterium]